MISIELWRARIGLHCSHKCNNPHSTDQPDPTFSVISAFIVCIITILLIIGGIEINPGPLTTTQDLHHKRELPAEIHSFIEVLVSTTLSFEQLAQSLSVSSSPIWGSICKKVYLRNKPDKRHSLYLKWKNNSYGVRTLVRDALSEVKTLVSPSSEEQFHVSYSLSSLTIQRRASLVTSTILKEISFSVAVCFDPLSSFEKNLDLRKLELNLVDDKLLIVWASSASDQAMYDRLKKESHNTTLSSLNSEGHNVYYMFNTTECQLWVDGAMFYELTHPRNVSGFLQFEEMCFFDECFHFISMIVDCKSFVECTPLVVLWLSEVQLESSYLYQMFGKKYVFLSGDDLSLYITWVKLLRDEYISNGIKCLESKYSGFCVKVESELSEHVTLPQSHDVSNIKTEKFETQMVIESSEIEVLTNTSSECGEFYLELSEWEDICISNSAGLTSLVRNWTNVFAEKFKDLAPMCVLKFANYWLKKPNSRKVNSPFFRARASCKFENCRSYIFSIDDAVNLLDNDLIVKIYSEGFLSLQHTDGQHAYSRHLSCSERCKMGDILVNNSVTKIYNKQFNNSNHQSLYFGNFTCLKSQDCLRKVKAEMKSRERFSNSYMEDVTATQQYFRYLLPESPLPGYVQYFVQDPFIVHMYSYKQLEILKLMNSKDIVLNFDATGSLISKPPSCTKKIFYYALAIQHPEFSTSPIPLAEMISSDHSTAEISHFLNKWCLSVKLFNTMEIKIKKVEIDFSWAMMHSTCFAFNKFSIINYLKYCWGSIANNENLGDIITVLHLCSAHIMHRISYNLNKKFKLEKSLTQIILHVFGRMVNCRQMKEINQLFGLVCYILCSKKQTSVYCNKLNQLEECITAEIIVSNDVPNEFEDDTEFKSNAVTYREKSPFGRHFDLIYRNTLVSISEVENNSQLDSVSYNPKIVEFLLTYYMPLLPLWSGIILCTINSSENATDSNAIVENWFRIVKHSILNSETGIRAGDFIRTVYNNIDDRIAAFKFAFTPLAHKVFKPKKRLRVENEEECKEEWSRSKKSKFSYTKPIVEKVSMVFTKFKSCKSFNVESHSSINKEVATIREENPNDVATVRVDIFRAGEVEIISDLDLVEVATMEYKLPAFQPLTYRGQKKLCEDLHLQLSDSTNSIRDNIPVNSNLKEYVPSKCLRIPGDGNCLFASLSYWLTGNIDSFNLVRLKVVENMLGNLKEACNKFIANKFPKSVINYRNVAEM